MVNQIFLFVQIKEIVAHLVQNVARFVFTEIFAVQKGFHLRFVKLLQAAYGAAEQIQILLYAHCGQALLHQRENLSVRTGVVNKLGKPAVMDLGVIIIHIIALQRCGMDFVLIQIFVQQSIEQVDIGTYDFIFIVIVKRLLGNIDF